MDTLNRSAACDDICESKKIRAPRLGEALFSMLFLVGCLAVGIIFFDAEPHIPMFIGCFGSILVAFRLGYRWEDIEGFALKGIGKVTGSIVILIVIGILVGVWLDAGVVPSMIYYGLRILRPSYFYVATLMICSVTSLATGSSWGTVGTMGVALMGIAYGLGMNPAITAGAIVSGAYFGDKTSPLSDTTNLAPAMAGTDVITCIKFMLAPTGTSYILTAVIFFFLGLGNNSSGADMSSVQLISDSLSGMFNVSPWHFIPVVAVLAAIALKMPAVPGITLGIISGAVIGLLTQPGCTLHTMFDCGLNGFGSATGIDVLDSLLSTGGLLSMMYAGSMAIIAMIFGGVMEETGQLSLLARLLTGRIHTPAALVSATEVTGIISDIIMPDQYISIIIPGRMYADTYRRMGLHPKTLANALSSSGAICSPLVPWNTCGLYVSAILGVSVTAYAPWCFFNYLTPVIVALLALCNVTVAYEDTRISVSRAA